MTSRANLTFKKLTEKKTSHVKLLPGVHSMPFYKLHDLICLWVSLWSSLYSILKSHRLCFFLSEIFLPILFRRLASWRTETPEVSVRRNWFKDVSQCGHSLFARCCYVLLLRMHRGSIQRHLIRPRKRSTWRSVGLPVCFGFDDSLT